MSLRPGISRILPAAMLVALVAGVHPARGRGLEQELPTGSTACWSRAYDSAHFLAHPQQKVTAMALSKAAEEVERGVIAVTLLVNLRDRVPAQAGEVRHYDYTMNAFCRAAGAALACENEYGLGGFRIERARGGILIRNPGRITLNPSNYDSEDISDNAVKVPARPDDGAWLLDSRSPRDCPY